MHSRRLSIANKIQGTMSQRGRVVQQRCFVQTDSNDLMNESMGLLEQYRTGYHGG